MVSFWDELTINIVVNFLIIKRSSLRRPPYQHALLFANLFFVSITRVSSHFFSCLYIRKKMKIVCFYYIYFQKINVINIYLL